MATKLKRSETLRGETSSQIHGRLLEALHTAGYSVERAWQRLEWLLKGERWKSVGSGFKDVNAFMGTIRLPSGITAEQRKVVAERIKELQPKASQRKIAGALGVDKETVARDLGKRGANAPVRTAPAETNKDLGAQSGANAPPEPDGGDVAVTAEGRLQAKEVREQSRNEKLAQLEATAAKKHVAGAGTADVVVIDPPWPMEMIERDVRPNQSELDYPTLDEQAIGTYITKRDPFAEDCHVWLWTTHKFLPAALELLDAWGLKYVCTFVWHKPGGFQPVNLPQYNSEFALYARRGSPVFATTKSCMTCFEAPRGRHSEKPEAFYDTVRRVTNGRRLDLFNRRKIEGFEGEGLEA